MKSQVVADSALFRTIKQYIFEHHENEETRKSCNYKVNNNCTFIIEQFESTIHDRAFAVFCINKVYKVSTHGRNNYFLAVDKQTGEVIESISVNRFNKIINTKAEVLPIDLAALFLIMNQYRFDRILLSEADYKNYASQGCIYCHFMNLAASNAIIKSNEQQIFKSEKQFHKLTEDCTIKKRNVLGRTIIEFYSAESATIHKFKFVFRGNRLMKYNSKKMKNRTRRHHSSADSKSCSFITTKTKTPKK